MQHTENDIVIRLRLQGRNGIVDAKNLLQSFDSVEAALYESDRNDIEQLCQQKFISRLVADASLERLRRYRHNRLLLVNAENGFIILDGVVASVPLYILKITLGEALEKAIAESKTFKDIKEWFRKQIDKKADYIANAMRKELNSKNKRFEIRQKDDGKNIEITLGESGNERDNPKIPSLGQELKND